MWYNANTWFTLNALRFLVMQDIPRKSIGATLFRGIIHRLIRRNMLKYIHLCKLRSNYIVLRPNRTKRRAFTMAP